MSDPGQTTLALSNPLDGWMAVVVGGLALALVLAALLIEIGRRRRLADDLAANAANYRMLFDSNPNPMYVYDVDSLELLAVNQTLLGHYGYAAATELVGQPVLTLHAEIEREAVRQTIARLASSGEGQFKRRWLHLRKDGECFPVEIFSQPMRYAGHQARMVVARDLGDQVKAELELLSQRHFRESLLEALPLPVFYKDRDGRYLGLNDAFLSFFGASREHFVGKTAWDIAPRELAARYQAADDDLYAHPDDTQVYSAQVMTKTNGLRDVIFTKAVFRDHQGQVAGLVGTVLDVTEREAADRALRESRAELAQILENSPLPIFVIDAEHRVVVWNPACERTFGVPAAQILGSHRQWSPFYPSERPVMADIVLEGGREPDVARYYENRYRRSPVNPEAYEAEDFFPHLGDGGRWLFFTASPLRDSSGKVVGAIETLLDITERKRAEEQARELNERLEARVLQRTQDLARANEELRLAMRQLVQTEKLASLGSLVAGVAHELNTPLGNVLTVATTLRDRTEDFVAAVSSGEGLRRSTITEYTNGCLEAARIVERNAQRAADLIGNFKEVAVDQTSTRRRRFDLREVIDELLATLQPTLRRTTHQISVEVPSGIVLDSYPGPLEQILGNLIMNSLLHGFEHVADGRIRLTAEADDDAVRLGYSDNGAGMGEETAQHAFDPFFTTKLGKGGSGLGLYIVYNLTTAVLGGNIALKSAAGEGAHFDLVLPRVAPRLAEPAEGQ
ncbi:PAS domain S-box protein [Azospira restricta]|uniref:histidine kinase n=1 Tax=Azospira restricta TaxID=404405 RepID=A0A974SQB6_9RHOO|nr:PAS domain S-box protein [Azospira restricta]QRJ64408.1 PAS domain S-box protein [Azospira restricta]